MRGSMARKSWQRCFSYSVSDSYTDRTRTMQVGFGFGVIRMRRFLLSAVMLSARPRPAQPIPLQSPSRPMREAAQQHYASGTRFFEEDQWDAALIEFIASLNPAT